GIGLGGRHENVDPRSTRPTPIPRGACPERARSASRRARDDIQAMLSPQSSVLSLSPASLSPQSSVLISPVARRDGAVTEDDGLAGEALGGIALEARRRRQIL